VAQEADAPPETPPPSNGAPEDDLELPEAAQFVTPGMEAALDRGAVGLMPGVAISVDPSGIPTGGTVEPGSKLSGDVAPTPDGDCSPVAIACAPARLHPKPVKADAHNAKATSGSNRSGREKLILILKGGLGMCGSPDISSTEG